MELRQLRYFIAVAAHLSFRKAARHIHISQPALSRQIADLEDRLGSRLSLRSNRGIKLTSAGQFFLTEATAILERIDRVTEKIGQTATGTSHSLTVGVMGSFEKDFLPYFLKKFHRNCPDITVAVKRFCWQRLDDAIVQGDIDIALTISQDQAVPQALSAEKLRSEPLTLVVPKDHPLADKSRIALSSLAEEPFIIMDRTENPKAYTHLLGICAKAGFHPNIVSQHREMETVLMLVESGAGITVLSRLATPSAGPFLRFVDIEDGGFSDLIATWRKDSLNPAICPFIQYLKQHTQA